MTVRTLTHLYAFKVEPTIAELGPPLGVQGKAYVTPFGGLPSLSFFITSADVVAPYGRRSVPSARPHALRKASCKDEVSKWLSKMQGEAGTSVCISHFSCPDKKQLKCDETKPQCKNCQSRDVPCPGYKKLLKWSTKYEVFKTDTSSTSSLPFQLSDIGLPKDDGLNNTSTTGSVIDLRRGDHQLPGTLKDGQISRDELEHSSSENACDIEDDSRLPTAAERQKSNPEPNQFNDQLRPDTSSIYQDSKASHEQQLIPSYERTDSSYQTVIDLDSRNAESVPESSQTRDRLSRILLKRFYRLPKLNALQTIHDSNSLLVEHYFRDVCKLYSSFDSAMNPYRASIARIWQSSAPIYYAIQSMAAAQLANAFPGMGVTGLEMQRKAYYCLKEELQLVSAGHAKSERVFLAMLLLGLTACWHDSSDLGMSHLRAARSLILPTLLDSRTLEDKETRRQNQFFEESLIYWEMLIGFVSPEVSVSTCVDDQQNFRELPLLRQDREISRSAESKILPHPWTGISPEIHMIFAEIGKLIRHKRLAKSMPETAESGGLETAKLLEETLLDVQLPSVNDLADTGDLKTPKADFISVAEVYRCTGLLELYRVFPVLLQRRLRGEQLSRDRDFRIESLLSPSFEATSPASSSHVMFLLSLSLHIISLLKSISPTSGTCFVQLLPIMAAASELRFFTSLDFFDIHTNDAKVLEARLFTEMRLQEFARRLPSKPLLKMLALLKEVWGRLDMALPEEDVFWVDIMIEKGWETVMG